MGRYLNCVKKRKANLRTSQIEKAKNKTKEVGSENGAMNGEEVEVHEELVEEKTSSKRENLVWTNPGDTSILEIFGCIKLINSSRFGSKDY
ncbi:unnamed protein product [Caenorhabditis angaria]|uniref:Uncharacterized protein n=1 Tax=Caenorhabditis angaria TaxID=860376 RepID=A0A9P1I8Q9_9PELO|nr:unnamed protein product [Caenorhabditis angaria]